MAVAACALLMCIEAMRYDDSQVILGSRHCDIQQAPLFLYLSGRSS